MKAEIRYREEKPCVVLNHELAEEVVITFSERKPESDIKSEVLNVLTKQYVKPSEC